MGSESAPGKKDPATQPLSPVLNSRAGLSGAQAAVANAPVQVFSYSSGGRGKV